MREGDKKIMVYNSSEYNADFVSAEINKAPLNVLLFENNNHTYSKELYELGKKTQYNSKQDISDIDLYLVPVEYNSHNDEMLSHYIDCRDFAINMLYQRWCIENKRPIKNPYRSNSFMKYMSEIGFFRSDYALIAA